MWFLIMENRQGAVFIKKKAQFCCQYLRRFSTFLQLLLGLSNIDIKPISKKEVHQCCVKETRIDHPKFKLQPVQERRDQRATPARGVRGPGPCRLKWAKAETGGADEKIDIVVSGPSGRLRAVLDRAVMAPTSFAKYIAVDHLTILISYSPVQALAPLC